LVKVPLKEILLEKFPERGSTLHEVQKGANPPEKVPKKLNSTFSRSL
jgi:hypothetical protein